MNRSSRTTSPPLLNNGVAWRSTFLRELLATIHGDVSEIRVLGDLRRRFNDDFRHGPRAFFFHEAGRQLYYPVRVRTTQKADEYLETKARKSQGVFDLTELIHVLKVDGRSVLLEAGTGAGKTVACLAAMFDCLHADPGLPKNSPPRLARFLPCPIRRFPDLERGRPILRAIADASGIYPAIPDQQDGWLDRLQEWYLASPPLLLFVDLNDVESNWRLPVAQELIEFLAEDKNKKHRAVVTYRDHAEDLTIAAIRKARLRSRRQKNRFGNPETMFCRISLDPMETGQARSYLTNLRRLEADYSRQPIAEAALQAELKILDDLIARFTPKHGSILNTPLMLYFVGDMNASTLKNAATPAALFDAVIEKSFDREREIPGRTLSKRDVLIAMGRLALAILSTGRTRLSPGETDADEAFGTLDRIFSEPSKTAELRGEKWIDRYWVGGIYTNHRIEIPTSRRSSEDRGERIFIRWANKEFAFVHDSYLYYFAACVLRCPKATLRGSPENRLDGEWREAVVRWWANDPDRWKETAEFLGGMLSPEQVLDLALDLIVASSGHGWPELARRLIRGHGPLEESSLLHALADAIDNKGVLRPGGHLDFESLDQRTQKALAPDALFSEVYHFLRDGKIDDTLRVWADKLEKRRQRPWIRADPLTSPTHWPPASYLHGSAIHDLRIQGSDLIFVDESGRLWRQDQERGVHAVASAPGGLVHFAISEDGTTLVGWDTNSQVWRIRADGAIEKLYRQIGIRAIATNRNGTVVVSGGRQRTIFRWVDDPGDEALHGGRQWFKDHFLHGGSQDDITAIVTDREGAVVFSGVSDGVVHRSEHGPDGLVKQEKLYKHKDLVSAITLTSDGQTIASGDMSGTVFRFGLLERKPEKVYNHRGESISAIAMSDQGQVIVTGGDPSVFRFVIGADSEPSHVHDHDGQVVAVSVSDDGESVVSVDSKGVIHRADSRTRNSILKRHRNSVNAIVVSHDGETIFTGGEDGAVHRASRVGIVPWRNYRHDSPVRWLALGPGCSFLVVYHQDGIVQRIGDGNEESKQLRCEAKAEFAAVSGDGDLLLFIDTDRVIRLARFSDGATWSLPEDRLNPAITLRGAFDGPETRREVIRQAIGPDAINLQGGFDPADRDGERFATASGWSIRLMERQPQGEPANVTAFLCRQDVTALAIAHDHSFLMAGLRNGQVLHLWIVDPPQV